MALPDVVSSDLPGELFPYQRVGVERLVREPSVLLADEMGLGKTIQAIAALRALKASGTLGSCLIIAPAGLVLQWRRQLRHWAPDLRLSTVSGPAEVRAAAWAAPADVHIAGYEAVRVDAFLRAAWAPGSRSWGVVILDEAQRIKNAGSELAGVMKRLKRERSWALTGTPLENRIEDLVSILDFVVPGEFQPQQMAVGLRRLVERVQLRRRRKEVLHDLPPKLTSRIDLLLTGRQAASYKRAEEEGLIRITQLGRDLRITHILELILRLKQICNFDPETGESVKLNDLRERIDRVVEAGEKALVFTQFVATPFGANQLALGLAQHRPLVLTGEVDPLLRPDIIAAFEKDPARPVLILSLKAGGTGLNLTAASHVFHFDQWWNPAVSAQAEDRAHRIGQTRPVHVHAYLCAATVEERIDEILNEKRALFADVIDGIDAKRLQRLDLPTLLRAVRG